MVDPLTSRPLQTYHCRHPTSVIHVPEVIAIPPPTLSPSPDPILVFESDILIALPKGIRQTRNHFPYYIDLCYHRISRLHYTSMSSLLLFLFLTLQVKHYVALRGDKQ